MKLSDVLEIAGLACFVVFAAVLFWPAALAVAGAELLFLGYAFSDTETDVNVVSELVRLREWVKARRAARKEGGSE